MSNTVQQIKDRLGIVEVVQTYLKLEKAGINYKARCPFHQEKTPSFFVSPARGSFYCFGCQRGGDILTFVQDIEGLDFMGALKLLAERAGVALEPVAGREFGRDPERESILAALERAQQFYAAALEPATAPRAYLAERGLTAEIIKQFGLGWAPAPAAGGWRALVDALRSAGVTEAVMEKAGLVIASRQPGSLGRYYDRFRSRLMFPLRDSSGRVVGFSGRIYPPDQADQGGKYINSPETAVYQKSRVLYGFDRAKLAIRQADQAILVEGQFDLLLSHQAGLPNTVAVSGTALTEKHLEQIARLTKKVVMAFDGDRAGLAAADRAVRLALDLGLEVLAARLPGGQDPADLIRAAPADWRERVARAVHVIDFLLGAIAERGLGRREAAHAIEAEVYPYIARLQSGIDQAHFINRVAELVGLAEPVIWEGVKRAAGLGPAGPRAVALTPAKSRLELIDERLAGLRFLGAAKTEAEIVELLSERADELKRQERLRILGQLTLAQKAGETETVKRLAEQIQNLSREINHLKK